jgi:hypothetical protein
MEVQKAWGVFVLTSKKHIFLSKIWVLVGSSWKQKRNIIPVPARTSGGDNMEQESHAQIQTSSQEPMTQVAGDWWGGSLRGVLTQTDQSGKTWLWSHSGLTHPWIGESCGSSCLDCCYGSPASQAGRSWRKVPLICLEVFSVKCGLGKWGAIRAGAPWWPEPSRLGEFILYC